MNNLIIPLIIACVMLLCGAIAFFLKYKQMKKTTVNLTLTSFVDLYTNNIVDLLTDVVDTMGEYMNKGYVEFDPNNTDLVVHIIDLALDTLYNESEKYDIDSYALKLLGNDTVRSIIRDIMSKFQSTIFAQNEKREIAENFAKDEAVAPVSGVVAGYYNDDPTGTIDILETSEMGEVEEAESEE